jgi:hypothetical protein
MVCTLLRLVSLLRKGALTLASLEYLVPDKADKLLELGFLEQCDEVLAACDGATVQRCLFSATMPPAVEDLVHSVLRQPVKVVVGEKNAAADTVDQSLVFCGREDGKLVALRQMVREELRPPVLIFVQSVERATSPPRADPPLPPAAVNQQPGTFRFVDDFIYQFLERSDNGGMCIYVRETFSSAGNGRFAFPARDVLQNLAARTSARPGAGGGPAAAPGPPAARAVPRGTLVVLVITFLTI